LQTTRGLCILRGVTKLQTFDFTNTQITDAGLVHLKGLTMLERLWLNGIQVTDAGVAELQKALLNCQICR